MPASHRTDGVEGASQVSQSPPDEFLLRSVAGGDAAALRLLIQRYDRLVRYTIFRVARGPCQRDPDWLDTVAGETWTGFVHGLSAGRVESIGSVPAYLVRVARNRAVSELRRLARADESPSLEWHEDVQTASAVEDNPAEVLSRIEQLAVLRSCIGELEESDRALVSQLGPITEHRWSMAAHTLEMPESTLRSRWRLVIERLHRCMDRKTDHRLAPPDATGDR